jgi:hypothetical protein
MVLIPLTTLIITYTPHFNNPISHALFASFGARLNWMWPDSFDLISKPWQWIIGRGLGGIGVAQLYFEPGSHKAADNLFVYLCVDFGLVSALSFIAIIVFMAIKSSCRASSGRVNLVFAIILATLADGIVGNVIESPTKSLFLAMAITAPAILNRCFLSHSANIPSDSQRRICIAPSPSH